MKLIGKLSTLGLSTTLYNWILDFLTDRQFGLVVTPPPSVEHQNTWLCAPPPLVHAVQP